MSFFIIRHAEKERGDFFNEDLGHQDQAISQEGWQQALSLSEFFADKPIAAIYVSQYVRTVQTIEPTAQQARLTPIIDERLNEIDIGCTEGLSDEEIAQKFPDVWKSCAERSADFRFPQGETGEEARCRVADFLQEAQQKHGNQNVILVSHDGLIRSLMCHVMGLPVYKRWNFQADTCGITEMEYQPKYGEWKVIRFNQRAAQCKGR